MHREPDWESLAEINFLLYRRMSEHLNAALYAISLIGTPEAQERSDEFWKQRGIEQVLKALNLHNAWSSLIRHKMGETFLPQHMRQFRASELLDALAAELQLNNIPRPENDMLLSGNRETLQEALSLLRSCAYTLGPSVHVLTDSQAEGIWFRIRFGTVKKPPPTLDALLDSLRGNWRVEGAAFELLRARDFLKMNECELVYSVGPKYGELAFFIYAVGKKPAGSQPAGTTQQLAEVNLSTTVILPESDTKPTALQGE